MYFQFIPWATFLPLYIYIYIYIYIYLCVCVCVYTCRAKFLEKIRPLFKENRSNHQVSTRKESWGTTVVLRFLESIWFYIQRKDGAKISYIWSSQRNSYSYNDALQKHECNGSLTWWRHRLVCHCQWCFTWSISTIFVYTRARLRTLRDLIKENPFTLKKQDRRYPTEIVTDADNAVDLAHLANAPAKEKSLLHILEKAVWSIGLHVNATKNTYILNKKEPFPF